MSETTDESKRNRRTAKRILAVGLPLVVIAGTGLGYAYWTATGTGGGTAQGADAPTGLVLSGTASGFAPGTSVVVPIMARNDNGYAVTVSSVSAAAHTASELNCGGGVTDDLSVGLASLFDGTSVVSSISVPAGAGLTQIGSVSVSMANLGYNQNACQNAILNLDFNAS